MDFNPTSSVGFHVGKTACLHKMRKRRKDKLDWFLLRCIHPIFFVQGKVSTKQDLACGRNRLVLPPSVVGR